MLEISVPEESVELGKKPQEQIESAKENTGVKRGQAEKIQLLASAEPMLSSTNWNTRQFVQAY